MNKAYKDLPPLDWSEPKYHDTRLLCIQKGLDNQRVVSDHEAYCDRHKMETVPAILGLHVCPGCAREALHSRREQLNINEIVATRYAAYEQRKAERK